MNLILFTIHHTELCAVPPIRLQQTRIPSVRTAENQGEERIRAATQNAPPIPADHRPMTPHSPSAARSTSGTRERINSSIVGSVMDSVPFSKFLGRPRSSLNFQSYLSSR